MGRDNAREQFFTAISKEKETAVWWCLTKGGVSLTTENDNQQTGLILAAATNKKRALDKMLEYVRKLVLPPKRAECLDWQDYEGRTAIMWAAGKGFVECVAMLKDAGADLTLKSDEGKTARAYALEHKRMNVVDFLDGKLSLKQEEEEEEEEEEDDPAFEGETSTQRSRRKKRELEEKERRKAGSSSAKAKQEEELAAAAAKARQQEDAEQQLQAVTERLAALWPAVQQAQESQTKELSIKEVQEGGEAGKVDPALWQVESINRLELRCGLQGGALSEVHRLKHLITIVVSGNSLTELPDSLQTLAALKHIECESNELTSLPALPPTLEVLKASRNKLGSVGPLSPLEQLVTLDVSFNELAVWDCTLSNKGRLNYLNVTGNSLVEFSPEVGQLGQLATLILNANKLEALPNELGDLKESKLKTLMIEDNPFSDPKLRKLVGKTVKDILNYVRKQGGGKGKKKK